MPIWAFPSKTSPPLGVAFWFQDRALLAFSASCSPPYRVLTAYLFNNVKAAIFCELTIQSCKCRRASLSMINRPSRRYFTLAARTAGLEARHENAVSKKDLMTPALFVVRQSGQGQLLGWQIRRFGGILLSRSETGYATSFLARSAGEAALTTMCSRER